MISEHCIGIFQWKINWIIIKFFYARQSGVLWVITLYCINWFPWNLAEVFYISTPVISFTFFSNVTDNMQKVCISISPGIPLRGDILIKCYHKKNNAGQREIIWGCQFHTCAISHNSLVFSKNELDFGINGK